MGRETTLPEGWAESQVRTMSFTFTFVKFPSIFARLKPSKVPKIRQVSFGQAHLFLGDEGRETGRSWRQGRIEGV